MSKKDPVKAATRTLDLFEAFVEARQPLTLTELADRIAVPISSCHALVKTLQDRGYVFVMEGRKRIYPTKRLMVLAAALGQHDLVLERLSPVIRHLARETGETVILGKKQGDNVVYLDVVEGSHTVRFTASPGDVWRSHSSAIGKSILSLLPDAELDRVLRRMSLTPVTDATMTDAAALKADIIASRKRGYFVSRSENVADVMGLASPHRLGEELYAIGIAGPIARFDENQESYIVSLRDAARAVAELNVEAIGGAI